ncbi:helicase RepA family protein [Novimethylophilus kurashikiensis]|nr:helicase RepA family protein [Novimethylophilus kurashikiensis]
MSKDTITRTMPPAADLQALLQRPAEALDFVLPGFKAGTVGGVISPGGVGKSYWALSLAVSLASSADLTGLAPKKGRIVVLSAEDGEDVFASRLHAVERYLPKGGTLNDFDFRDCVGLNIDLMEAGWFDAVLSIVKGARLVVLDTLSRFHSLDENATPDMKRLLAQLERLATVSGAAVMYLHHTSKSAAISGMGALQQAARGSSVLVDNARWVSFLAAMTEHEARKFGLPEGAHVHYVRWNISKQNYGAPLEDQWFKRVEDGVLLPCTFDNGVAEPQTIVRPQPMPVQTTETRGPADTVPGLPSAKGAFDGKW